jgi:cobalt/nickel transport system permease protein
MTLALEPLPCPESPLRHLDPRWKLAALLVAAAVAATVRTLPAAAAVLAGAVLLAVLGRLPRRWYLARLGALLGFLALFLGFIPFLVHDDGPGLDLGPLRLSWHGVAVAGLLCMRAAALVTLVLVLLATAPVADTLKAAHALRVPGLLVQLAVLTYRYIFVLADELGRLRVALRVRGYRNRMTRHSYRTVGHVAGTLLVRGAERAERVGQAMRCRGFDGHYRSLAAFRTTLTDVAAFVLIGGGAAGLWLWERLE